MRKILCFFALTAGLIGGFVLLNVSQWDARIARAFPKADFTKQLKYLFQNGHIHPRVSLSLYRAGISTRPKQAVVGQGGWMYLGDAFNQAVSKAHGHFEEAPDAIQRWNFLAKQQMDALDEQGIPLLFLLAPNKHSIYPEHAPEWLSFQDRTFTDRLLTAAAEWDAPVVDPRGVLQEAKEPGTPLYGVTDTHWTHLGAFLAFQALERVLETRFDDFTPVPEGQLSFVLEPVPACCLARLIGIASLLPRNHDSLHRMHTPSQGSYLCSAAASKPDRKRCEAIDAGAALKFGEYSFPVSRNPKALNDMHVLLILDSFGEALSPLFHLSFSRVTKMAVGQLVNDPSLLEKAVTAAQPDLVIFQVVERNLLLPYWGESEQKPVAATEKRLPI